jgi:hypothetical protein
MQIHRWAVAAGAGAAAFADEAPGSQALAAPTDLCRTSAVLPARVDVTSAVDKKRVDRVRESKLDRCGCRSSAESAMVRLPLDYDIPNGVTTAPLLFVGNHYDPATNHAEAVSASRLLPNSRLLPSDSWCVPTKTAAVRHNCRRST